MKEYTVKELNRMFAKSIALIVILAVLFGGVFGFLAKQRQHTTYTAEREIMISHNYQAAVTQNNDQNAQVMADQNLMPTYEDLVQSKSVAQKTHALLPKKLKKAYSTDDIYGMINAKSHQQSLIMNIKIKGSSAKDVTEIANVTAVAAQKELPKLKAGIGTVTPLSKATVGDATSETTPHAKKYLVAGVALGGLIGIIISFGEIVIKDFIRKNSK